MSHLHHKSQQLRTQSLIKTVEAVLVLFAAIFVTALLPSLLIQYVYSGQALFEQPAALQYIPVVSFIVGIGYFIYAMVGNIMREGKARRYDVEAEAMGDHCDCGHHHGHDEDLAELEAMIDQAEAESKAEVKSNSARKSTKKAGKKSAKKNRR